MPNRLAQSRSRYLLQHQHDPVNWQPWDSRSLAEARERGCPLLISIGYSSCHWCHVMARETFNDPEVAAYLNANFVCIKVDREERPDLDAYYMQVLTSLQGGGGWPVTAFAMPGGEPLYATTFLPPRATPQLPGLLDLAARVAKALRDQPDQAAKTAASVVENLSSLQRLPQGKSRPAAEVIETLCTDLYSRFDRDFGGFGHAPKFPQPHVLETLWKIWRSTGDRRAEEMVTLTLQTMASGALFDHVDGGFFRYATDRFFMAPHFEKMLPDQAGLLPVYARVAADRGDAELAWVASRIVGFTEDTLSLGGGRYAVATDADSGGVEGGYYAFRMEEFAAAGAGDVATYYGATKGGNFEGGNLLHRPMEGPLPPPEKLERQLEALSRLRAARSELGVDTKATCDTTAQWASALIQAGRWLGRKEWVERGIETVGLLDSHFLRHGALTHLNYEGEAQGPGFGADYAHYSAAQLEAFSSTGDAAHLERSLWSAEALLAGYLDAGGAVTTARKGEGAGTRTADTYDGAQASSTSVFAGHLTRLAAVSGSAALDQTAAGLFAALSPLLNRVSQAVPALSWAYYESSEGTAEVVLPGRPDPDLLEAALASTLPNLIVVPGDASPLARDREPGFAYLCHHRSCDPPTADATELQAALEALGAR